MIELRFFQFNVGLIPLILTMITVFFQVFTLFQIWWYDEEINFYHFIYDNLFYFPFFLLLLIATCFNVVIINEKGVTRIAYLMPFLRKSFKWKKIKHHAKVLEFYNQRGIKNTKKSLWLIDSKDRLFFRLIDNYENNTDRIFDIVTRISKKSGIELKVENPLTVRNGFSKVKYPKKSEKN